MKLTKKASALLACTASLGMALAACGSSSDDGANTTNTGDGDGDSGGDGDGDEMMSQEDPGETEEAPVGPQCDEPGGAQCTGSASGLICAEGTTNAAEFTCATGEVCVDGGCEPQCEEGTTECVGGAVQRVCVAGGREWVSIPCQNGEVCEEGACGLEGGLECVPGEKDCEGNTARTCREDGSGWDEEECPGATACTDGACVGTVCTVGATKCDESMNNYVRNFRDYFLDTEGEGEVEDVQYNDQVIYRCVDGERWVAETCASTEEVQTACVYQNVDAADAARYRQEGNEWLRDAILLFESGSGDFPTAEFTALDLPTVPEFEENAVCAPVECEPGGYYGGLPGFFFETAVEARWCGDFREGEDDTPYDTVSQCDGVLPFAAPHITTTECTGLTACGNGRSRITPFSTEAARGCQAVECLPGESLCDSEEEDGSYALCDFNSFFPGASSFDFGEADYCPEKDDICSDNGEVPQREIACDGVLLSDIPPPVLIELE